MQITGIGARARTRDGGYAEAMASSPPPSPGG
jgi:hypothetical protein